MERIPTGIAALDEMLHGGFPEGSMILLVGSPGSGKTIFAHQMMYHNAASNQKSVYLTTLAEPQIKVMRFQQTFRYFDPEKFQQSVIYQDLGFALRKYGPAKAITVIDELLQKHHPKLMVIDTIKTMSDMITSFTEFREFTLDLSVKLATWGCTALVLGEYSEEEIEIRPESALADGIILLSGTEDKKQQKRFLRIIKMRGTAYAGGENYFTISSDGIEIFPRLNPIVTDQTYDIYKERIASGLQGLDEIMGGGIPYGSTTLLSGASGTGKTVLALHYTYAGLQAGEPVIFATFEENPAQIVQTAARLGRDLEPYLASGLLHFMHVSPMELDVDEHVYRIQQNARNFGTRRVIIDSISSFEVGMRDKVKYTDYIWSLCDFLKISGISVLLTHEMQDSGQVTELTKHGISYIADNLILLRFLEKDYTVRRCLRVIKMRSSSHSFNLHEYSIEQGKVWLNTEPFHD